MKSDKKLILELWSSIENGTLERDFFKLREQVRKSLLNIENCDDHAQIKPCKFCKQDTKEKNNETILF